jgi:hypothetical protein
VILRVEGTAGDATFVGIRAHHVEIVSAGDGGENTFPCEIVEVVESPFEVTLYLRLGGATLEAEMPRGAWSRPESPRVRLDPRQLLLLRE